MSLFDTEIVEIESNLIKVGVNIYNVRTHFDSGRVQELADSIEADGLMVPLVVFDTEDDDGNDILELIAGERRLRAIQLLQKRDPDFMKDGIPCIMFAGTLHDAKYINVTENIDREDINDVDVSAWIFRRAEEGVTQTEIASRLKKSQPWVSVRVMFHDRAADELKQAVLEGLINFTTAVELCRNFDKEEQVKRIEKVRRTNEKLTVEDVRAAADPNKVKRPGKKARQAMLKKADNCTTDVARGISFALRYVEGEISENEMQEIIQHEASL